MDNVALGGAGFVSVPPKTDEALRLWKLESALERIANSKHGDRQWMQGVARTALAEQHRRE